MHSAYCLNCNELLTEGKAYCANCSQKTNTHRISFHEILHDAVHAITHADKGFFFLVKELVSKPGIVAKEYIAGKRKKYYNPFSFLVIITGLLVIVSSNLHPFGNEPIATKKRDYTKVPVEKAEKMKALDARAGKFVTFVNKHSNVVLFISTPFMAFFFWRFYRKQRLFYAEHLTAMVFFNSFMIMITIILFAPLIYFTRHMSIYNLWLAFMLLFHVLYLSLAYKQLFSFKGVKGYARAFAYSLLAVFCWIVFSVTLGSAYIIWGF